MRVSLLLLGCLAACGPLGDGDQPRWGWGGKGDQATSCQLVKGSFALTYQGADGYQGSSSPDGDSMWFRPDTPGLFQALGARANAGGLTQLRFRSIDALELHYQGGHQNGPLARQARDALLALAGFSEVTFTDDASPRVERSVPASTRGHVLVTGVGTYGRPLVYVFAGEPAEVDGAVVDGAVVGCDADRIATKSFNAELLRRGLVYPSFYGDLSDAVRLRLAEISRSARRAGLGVWALDRSQLGLSPDELLALGDQVLLPVLFRRYHDYLRDPDGRSLTFVEWLKATDRDAPVMILAADAATQAAGTVTRFSGLVEMRPVGGRSPGEQLRLVVAPEEIVRVPDGSARASQLPAEEPPPPSPLDGQVVITELMANPQAVGDDQGEYIELYNASASPVDLRGWTLKDDDRDVHPITASVLIAPGQRVVLGINGDPARNGGVAVAYQYGGFFLGQKGDEIALLDAEGQLVDRVAYPEGAVVAGASYELVDPTLDNGTLANWRLATQPWSGSAGDKGTPGAGAVTTW